MKVLLHLTERGAKAIFFEGKKGGRLKCYICISINSNHMRKIETQMNQAIRGQRNWAGSNTTVFTSDNGLESTVYLHGNHIATYFHDKRKLQIFDGGWQSNTTKSRLNALLDEFDYGSWVFQKNWVWFLARNFNPAHKVGFTSGMVV